MFYSAIGTDTGGSIRIPAGYCGVSGLMPTFGRVPKSGCVPLGYSLDHIGPLARSAADCAAVLAAIAGPDPSDPDCVDAPFTAGTYQDLSGLRIGVVTDNHLSDDADPALSPAFEAAVSVLAKQGADVFETRLPLWAEVSMANMVTMVSEAFAYHRQDLRDRWADYFSGTRGVIALGALISGADYVQAQRVRRVAQQALGDLFSQADLVVGPTLQTGAPSYESLTENGKPSFAKLGRVINTSYWDSVGNPVLAVPIGFTDSVKPLSMQIAAAPFGEAVALRAGQVYQEHTDWHLRQPAGG